MVIVLTILLFFFGAAISTFDFDFFNTTHFFGGDSLLVFGGL